MADEDHPIHPVVARRRKLMGVFALAAVVVLAISTADHAGWLRSNGDDWARFNGQSVTATRVIDGDTIEASTVDHADVHTMIQLLGIDAPDLPAGHGAAASLDYVTKRLANRSVVVRLDGTQTRDASGALRAYLYVTPNDCLNADCVRDGMAYADRRGPHSLRAPMEQFEREARAKKRGLWNGLHDSDQPAWRQAWLKEWLARRANSL